MEVVVGFGVSWALVTIKATARKAVTYSISPLRLNASPVLAGADPFGACFLTLMQTRDHPHSRFAFTAVTGHKLSHPLHSATSSARPLNHGAACGQVARYPKQLGSQLLAFRSRSPM